MPAWGKGGLRAAGLGTERTSSRVFFMKSLSILFVSLFLAFIGAWFYKANIPIQRPNEVLNGEMIEGAWWQSSTVKKNTDDSWKLDPTIEPNYIPVPGEEDLFMVIDINTGEILCYKRRTRQLDGSYKWETVDPNIPDNYEPVKGLENVYKVTDENGNVSYKKYIRNKDDTYAFIDVDEFGNPLNYNSDATTIDGKHVHISGNTYKLLDENGVVIGYDKRVQNEDGSFSWVPIDMPDIQAIADEWSNMGSNTAQSEGQMMDMNEAYDELNNNLGSNMSGDPGNMTFNSGGDTIVNVEQKIQTSRHPIRSL